MARRYVDGLCRQTGEEVRDTIDGEPDLPLRPP
jgi:hypothetical protein